MKSSVYATLSFIYKAAISLQPLFTKIQIIKYHTFLCMLPKCMVNNSCHKM